MTALDSRPRRSRSAWPRLAAIGVAILGALLLLLAVARTTVWANPGHTVVHVAGQQGKPVIVTSAAAFALDGPSVRVTVRAADPGQNVFVGVGRAGDVAAYLGSVARTEVTGVRGSGAELSSSGTDSSLPEPAGVDVWALAMTGRGTATLVWPHADGSWRMVGAVDGAAPPAEVIIDWERQRVSSVTPALFAVGGLLLVLGLVGIRATRRGRRTRLPAADESPQESGVPEDDDVEVQLPAPFRSERRS